MLCAAAPEPEPPAAATMPALASFANASALPLFAVTETVGTTAIWSPLFGMPARLSSKPFSAIGEPAVQVPVPVLPSLIDQA